MDQHALITLLLLLGSFLGVTALLQSLSKRISFPYTVILLYAGLIAQLFVHYFNIPIHFELSPELIYFVLLPLLLFESAFHINLHQFKLQFKTITFLSTFGLLLSIFLIGFGGVFLLGLPFEIAILFGALISATDPIAVIALFKTLGAPKRLTLLADGESMFNDATAVIAFRIISGIVLGGAGVGVDYIGQGVGNFMYIFFGSMLFGSFVGYLSSKIIQWIKNDSMVETSLTVVLALSSFVVAEHFFHLSGVISTVIAGILLGNLGSTKISPTVKGFVNELWEFIAFLCVSFVFFFAAFTLDTSIFTDQPLSLLVMIGIVLIARAISVYVTVWLSNTLPFFKNEPDIPLSWQHILNWGGLRGVIPLVLVYSLPEDFIYREQILAFTLSTLVFTILVNGVTVQWLLKKLGLHIPKKEEAIIHDEMDIFAIENVKKKLRELPKREFDKQVVQTLLLDLENREEKVKKHLLTIADKDKLTHSLKLQSIEIERYTLRKLYEERQFIESVFYEFESELDLQQDALEYPEVYRGRGYRDGGYLGRISYRQKLLQLRRKLSAIPFINKVLHVTAEDIIRERYNLLRARLFTSYAVEDYLDSVEKLFISSDQKQAIKEIRQMQEQYIAENISEVSEIEENYPAITADYQKTIIQHLVTSSLSSHYFHK